MQSHELARQLLAQPDKPIQFQAGHDMEEGDILPDVLSLDFLPANDAILLEVGDMEHPALDDPEFTEANA